MMVKTNLTNYKELEKNIQNSTNLKVSSNKNNMMKTLYYKSYEIQFLKKDTIILIVYNENFQTLIGSKDNIKPFDYPILTEFKNKFGAVKYIKGLINLELDSRKEHIFTINEFNKLSIESQNEIQDFISGITTNFEVIKK